MTIKNIQGIVNFGQDTTSIIYNTSADLNPSGTGVALASAGVTLINFSGTASTVVTLPVGLSNETRQFSVADINGHANSQNIVVSGTNGETFNGSSTSSITTAYGQSTFRNYGVADVWYKI